MIDERGARIVVDGIGFTNEAIPDPAGRFLYVYKTQGRRISRLPITGDVLGAELLNKHGLIKKQQRSCRRLAKD